MNKTAAAFDAPPREIASDSPPPTHDAEALFKEARRRQRRRRAPVTAGVVGPELAIGLNGSSIVSSVSGLSIQRQRSRTSLGPVSAVEPRRSNSRSWTSGTGNPHGSGTRQWHSSS
jgi:hypothetical protein